jgi:hypothetical protein
MNLRWLAPLFVANALLFGCKASLTLGPSYPANQPQQLRQVAEHLKAAPRSSRPPVAYLVTDAPAGLAAVDLRAGSLRWRIETPVLSRVHAAGALLVHMGSDSKLVARRTEDGTPVWSVSLAGKGELIGFAGDGERVYVASAPDPSAGDTAPPAGRVFALDARDGDILWVRDTIGTVGVPSARAGYLFVPFRRQSIAILDGGSGEEVARVRSHDEALLWTRAASGEPLTFGGRGGVYVLDQQAGRGRDRGATFLEAELPDISHLDPPYWRNAYYQTRSYTAFDRARVLWRIQPTDPPDFRDGLVFLQHYRFVFAFEKPLRSSGEPNDAPLSATAFGGAAAEPPAASRPVETQTPSTQVPAAAAAPASAPVAKTRVLSWAVHLGGKDIVASSHAGRALLLVTRGGEVVVLDASSGAQLLRQPTGLIVRGAHFDAEDYAAPSTARASVEPLLTALMRIVRDPDRRFDSVKLFCVEQIARLDNTEASAALLQIVQQGIGPAELQRRAGELLVQRRDAAAVPLFVEALRSRYSYSDDQRPRGVAVLARALGGLKATEALPLLTLHLVDHETPIETVEAVLEALHVMGDPSVLSPVRDFLLTYRCEPRMADSVRALKLAAQVLLDVGGEGERQLLDYVADDVRSLEELRIYLSNQLAVPAPDRDEPAATGEPTGGQPAVSPPTGQEASAR